MKTIIPEPPPTEGEQLTTIMRPVRDLRAGELVRHPETRQYTPVTGTRRIYDVNLYLRAVFIEFADGAVIDAAHDRTIATKGAL